MAYKSRKYELCSLKAECTKVAKEFTAAVLLDVNKIYNVPSRTKHEAWVEFINDTIQILSLVIVCRADPYEVNFILNTVAQFAKSLVWGNRVWFVIPSQLYLN